MDPAPKAGTKAKGHIPENHGVITLYSIYIFIIRMKKLFLFQFCIMCLLFLKQKVRFHRDPMDIFIHDQNMFFGGTKNCIFFTKLLWLCGQK